MFLKNVHRCEGLDGFRDYHNARKLVENTRGEEGEQECAWCWSTF
jgi:hypothetical protein